MGIIETREPSESDPGDARIHNDRLAAAANRGDRGAAGEYFARNSSYLYAIARWLVDGRSGVVDPDDLAADALARLVSLWSEGRGPNSGPNAYVIRSMRNRLVDEFRSPRSRVTALAEEYEDPSVTLSTRDIDLYREYRYVRSALSILPKDQQAVLRATLIEGRKPAELEDELSRPASAIYSLGLRARKSLRKATLRVVLEDGAPDDCRHAAARLPDQVALDVDGTGGAGGMIHVRQCPRCRKAWSRFGAMASLLGVASVFTVGTMLFETPAVQASINDTPRSSGRARRDAARARRHGICRSPLTLLGLACVGGGLALVGAVGPSVLSALGVTQLSASTTELRATSQSTASAGAELVVDFRAESISAVVSVALPSGVTVVNAPKGWDCRSLSTEISCRAKPGHPGTFHLSDARAEPTGTYLVNVNAESDGQVITGFAKGRITSERRTVTASVE